jgi:hypothetical protein
VFDHESVEVLTMNLELSAPITGVTIDSSDAKFATLVTMTSDGMVQVVQLNVRNSANQRIIHS